MWSLAERDALAKGLLPHSPLRTALEQFLEARATAEAESCASYMRSVPRQWELAADHAAKSEVYRSFLAELERELEKL